MKNYSLLFMIVLLSVSCNSQNNDVKDTETNKSDDKTITEPKGTWTVDKEYDENGNLTRYDSIYSWSTNDKYNDLSLLERDSLMRSFKSRFFTDFSGFESQGFEDIFSKDSLFSKHFFNDDFFESDFGSDFMDLNKIRNRLIERQKKFLERYQTEFIDPKDKN